MSDQHDAPWKDDALWLEAQAIEAVIRADAAAAYHRELARAAGAVAHHVVTQIWPQNRRDELQQYRMPASTTEAGNPPTPESDSGSRVQPGGGTEQ